VVRTKSQPRPGAVKRGRGRTAAPFAYATILLHVLPFVAERSNGDGDVTRCQANGMRASDRQPSMSCQGRVKVHTFRQFRIRS
jgi:hypothetical protein